MSTNWANQEAVIRRRTCYPFIQFIHDEAPAHNNPTIPGGHNTELKKSPPYSPFLNIVEQEITFLKAAIKTDITRPEIQEQITEKK